MSEITHWDAKESEYLTHHSIDEAVEDFLDGHKNPLPATVKVIGYKRREVNLKKFTDAMAVYAQEYLDEEYGGEDGHETEPEHEAAAKAFCEEYLKHYTPWQCEPCATEVVNTLDWIKRVKPGWLTENEPVVVAQ